jgi:hypothetical protein
VKIVRAGWTSASFLAYAGALMVLVAAFFLLGVISDEHSAGAFAGWSALAFAVAASCAVGLRRSGRPVPAGLFAIVSVGLFAILIGAFLDWFGWLHGGDGLFSGFHWGVLAIELLTLLAALVAIRSFRFPLLAAAVAGVGWYFVTDVLSSGGNWSAVVTLLVGCFLFFAGLVIDRRPTRPYGFWVHVTAGLTIGGALLYFWHASDTDWALIIVASLVYIALAALIRRSSYAVLGAVGLVLATGYFSLSATFPFFFGEEFGGEPAPWAAPLAFVCLGFFLALLGLLLWRRTTPTEAT